MLWPTKPHDIADRLSKMSEDRRDVLRWIGRAGGELTYERRGKSIVWKAALPDSGGAFNVYERRQDHIGPAWVLEMGRSEMKPFAIEIYEDMLQKVWAVIRQSRI